MKNPIKLHSLTVDSNSTVYDAMMVINRNGQGICFAMNHSMVVGVLTDGDIRRALLGGHHLSSPIDCVMKKDFVSLPVNSGYKKIQDCLEKHKIIPVLDKDGNLADYASLERYHQIPLVQPVFDGNELEYITDCISSGWISSQGKYINSFENAFAEYVGSKYALAVSNGTVALHLGLVALGVKPEDEIIVPTLTFAAPVNAILYCGATPVFVDVDLETLTVSIDEISRQITSKTRAILLVHLYGRPANMDEILDIANKNNLLIIEDCAEAFGSYYKDKHVGTFGNIGTFSFFGNKTLTTGEGGMVLFADEHVYKKAKILRDHGMDPNKRYWHEIVGFNYRMTNMQAAIGVAQMEKADMLVDAKRKIANLYARYLSENPNVMLPQDGKSIKNSFWLYTIIVKSLTRQKRDLLLENLAAKGIESRPVFSPVHCMPPYKKFIKYPQTFKNSEIASNVGISLPSASSITESDIEMVCKNLLIEIDRL